MFTLVARLTLVALSGAALLHMTLDDGFQRATRSPRRRRVRPSPAPLPLLPAVGRSPGPGREEPAGPGDGTPEAAGPSLEQAASAPGPSPSDGGGAQRQAGDRAGKVGRSRARGRRLRSGTLLVALLLTVGGVLALVIAVALGLLVAALRAAVG